MKLTGATDIEPQQLWWLDQGQDPVGFWWVLFYSATTNGRIALLRAEIEPPWSITPLSAAGARVRCHGSGWCSKKWVDKRSGFESRKVHFFDHVFGWCAPTITRIGALRGEKEPPWNGLCDGALPHFEKIHPGRWWLKN